MNNFICSISNKWPPVDSISMFRIAPTNFSTLLICWWLSSETALTALDVCDSGLSDHLAITVKLHLCKSWLFKKLVLTRNYKCISVKKVCRDLQQCDHLHTLSYDISLASTQQSLHWTNLMGRHMPATIKIITMRLDVEWFDDDIHKPWRKQRQLGWKWRKNGPVIDHQICFAQRQTVSSAEVKDLQVLAEHFSETDTCKILTQPLEAEVERLATHRTALLPEPVLQLPGVVADTFPIPLSWLPRFSILAELLLAVGVSNSISEAGFSSLIYLLSDRQLSMDHTTMEDFLLIQANNALRGVRRRGAASSTQPLLALSRSEGRRCLKPQQPHPSVHIRDVYYTGHSNERNIHLFTNEHRTLSLGC